jgi:hypothetical protein
MPSAGLGRRLARGVLLRDSVLRIASFIALLLLRPPRRLLAGVVITGLLRRAHETRPILAVHRGQTCEAGSKSQVAAAQL